MLLEPTALTSEQARPQPSLALIDAIALIVGVVIGAGIFETPALVAANTGNATFLLVTWFVGGVVSVIGALCYSELATTYPHVGGNYYYLKRTFGDETAFLFAWARMTVIQTGSIVLLAFVFGDYAAQLVSLGPFSASIYAALAIALLSALNIIGLQFGKQTQNWLTAAKVLGLILVVLAGLLVSPSVNTAPPGEPITGNWGLAMLFVLLSYGGWNEAAYISAEIRNGRRNILRSLLWSIGIITVIYLLINLACVRGLGFAAMAQSSAVAADLMRRPFGEVGAKLISLLIAISTLGAINATIFTGARTSFALGQDFSLFGFLGRWQPRPSAPTPAFLLQGAIALALVVLGTITRKGFETMVDYTAPVFWFFFLLSGVSLLVLRRREPDRVRPFQVPLYPYIPLLFCAVCGYLFYSSLAYTGLGAIAGIAMVGLGVPLLVWNRRQPEM
ncbi:MAG: amino acid permease [Oscillatoriales cyanobacterium C42_A2020_001]|nr:amino acid permease [Leptolyngbyaceae cyanobacterium C42_A2020_001]